MASRSEDEERAAEARRVLRGVERDSESLGTSSLVRAADHFTAKDADQNDPAELWGKRVGRGVAAVAFVVLAIWLVGYLMR